MEKVPENSTNVIIHFSTHTFVRRGLTPPVARNPNRFLCFINQKSCNRADLWLFCPWLQVGEEAWIAVKSTCPCNFTLHYEVASRGNIVLSGLQPSNVTQQRSKRATTPFERNIDLTRFPGTGSQHQKCNSPLFSGKNNLSTTFVFNVILLKGYR